MGSWARLAARAAFRPGQSNYCGYRNDVALASWVGGIVGLKSILGISNRQKELEIMDTLTELGYISYTLDKATKKLSYTIKDWVVECSGAACADGAIYATDGYGFLCLPRNITQRLVDTQYQFEESDAWLDLWCHTVWRDPNNVFSHMAPTVQFGREGAALTLEKLGTRWGWGKTKVWRFLQKHEDTFPLRKLPGSYGCLIFNARYSDAAAAVPDSGKIVRILGRIRILGQNTYFEGTDNQRLNRMIAVYSRRVVSDNRVALPLTDAIPQPTSALRRYYTPCARESQGRVSCLARPGCSDHTCQRHPAVAGVFRAPLQDDCFFRIGQVRLHNGGVGEQQRQQWPQRFQLEIGQQVDVALYLLAYR